MRTSIQDQDESFYKLKSRRDELKVRMERRLKEVMMLKMSCQEAKDAEELALREKDRLVLTHEKLKALSIQQEKIKKDYNS